MPRKKKIVQTLSLMTTPPLPSTTPLTYVISSPSSDTMTDLSAYDHVYDDIWEPYTEDEYYYEDEYWYDTPTWVNPNNKWYFEEDFTEDVKHECFKNCDCSEIIYNDIINYLFENKEFKHHYNAAKNYPNLRSNKIDSTTSNKELENNHFYLLLKIILDEVKKYQDYEARIGIDTLCKKGVYIPRNRSWFLDPCKNIVNIYSKHEYSGRYSSEDQYYTWPEDQYFKYIYDCNSMNDGLYKMVMSCFVTYIFNLITHKDFMFYMENIIERQQTKKLKGVLQERLVEFKKETSKYCGLPYCKLWRGSDYYYKKLFYKSIYLHDLNVEHSTLKLKYLCNFETQIYGHPKASNGLCQESLQELKQMGVIKDEHDE